MTKISDKDEALIRLIQDDLPHDHRPFLWPGSWAGRRRRF